jgi:peptidoglycan/LPS O-acetylase OafA/YrhL
MSAMTRAPCGHAAKQCGDGRLFQRVAALFKGAVRELIVPNEQRVPFLDGLRALAVLLVINNHIGGAFAAVHGSNFYTRCPFTKDGWFGVDLFFVLSGYFIGSQLWRELDRTGTISIGNFIIRRGLRIWPLYIFVFIAVSILRSPAYLAAREHGWSDLVFLTNYLPYGIVIGSWSLCSEEHFYILAPLTLFLVGKRSMRSYRWGLNGLLIVEVIVRGVTYAVRSGGIFVRDPQAFRDIYYPFHTHCDGLIAGLILATLTADGSFRMPSWARPWLFVIAGLFAAACAIVVQREILYFFGFAMLFASLVWFGLKSAPQMFSSHVFYVLSRLSFGMYLNHEYMGNWVVTKVTSALGLLHLGAIGATATSFVILTALSMGLSAVTFCLVEHPFLVLRTAILRRRAIPHLVAH